MSDRSTVSVIDAPAFVTESSVFTISLSNPAIAGIPAFETVYNTLSNYLSPNPVVFGAAVAFNPEILFASPFVFRGENGIERTNIADTIDYTETVWYQTPLQLGSAAFSPPYFDVGGAGEDVALPELKKARPWFAEIDSTVLQQNVKRLDKAYENFFSGRGFPKFKNRSNFTSFTFAVGIKIQGNKIYLPKLGWMRFHNSRAIPDGFTIPRCDCS